MKILNKEQFIRKFIEKANIIHKNKYDYSLVDFVSSKTKIKIICPEHGQFEQIPPSHLTGRGCKKCGIIKNGKNKSFETNEFLKLCKNIHGDEYEYHCSEYKNMNTKININCKIHGIFSITPNCHINGKQKCPNCILDKNVFSFKEKATKLYNNKYDYSLSKFSKFNKKIKIICSEHGSFYQSPSKHLIYSGCKQCGLDSFSDKMKYTSKIFIDNAIKIHGDKYDYSLIDYKGAFIKIDIVCKKHGVFKQIPTNHLSGVGCPICNSSKAEQKIINYLKENKITYIHQFRIKECRNKQPLPFDFFIPNINTLIEYQGEQHYKEINFSSNKSKNISNFIIRKQNDLIKKEYCLKNNIKLVEITYKDNIIKKLDELFNF